MRRSVGWGLLGIVSPAIALADPLPVIAVSAGERGPSAAEVARAAAAAGADVVQGAALRDGLAPHFGRFAPREDVLAAPRAEVAQGWDAYFRSGPRASRRRLAEAVTAMEAAADALALRDDNRAAYLRALGMLARIDLEARQAAEAEGWARRALRLDPAWTPPANEFPPPVQQLAARLRATPAAAGEGRVVVRLPREGCGVTVDGVARPGTAREQAVPARAGTHRVFATCGETSRVRAVEVRAGETAAVSIDPELDARVRLTGEVSVAYASAQEEDSLLAHDAAALGRALGARQVLAVSPGSVRVIAVDAERPLGAVDLARDDLAAALVALRTGRAASPPPRPPPAPRRVARGVGAGPWAVAGAGAGLAVAGVVFWTLRAGAYDDLAGLCPMEAGVPQCPDAAARDAAAPRRDEANLWQGLAIGAWATGGAAITAGLLWYALGRRAPEAVSVAASPRGVSATLRW